MLSLEKLMIRLILLSCLYSKYKNTASSRWLSLTLGVASLALSSGINICPTTPQSSLINTLNQKNKKKGYLFPLVSNPYAKLTSCCSDEDSLCPSFQGCYRVEPTVSGPEPKKYIHKFTEKPVNSILVSRSGNMHGGLASSRPDGAYCILTAPSCD